MVGGPESQTTTAAPGFAGCGRSGPPVVVSQRSHHGSAKPSRTSLRLAAGDLGLVFLRRDLLADLLERTADQAGHVHLRDPDLLRDLRLRQALEEAEMQNLALAVVEDAEARREHCAVLRDFVLVLLGADGLEWIEFFAVLSVAAS